MLQAMLDFEIALARGRGASSASFPRARRRRSPARRGPTHFDAARDRARRHGSTATIAIPLRQRRCRARVARHRRRRAALRALGRDQPGRRRYRAGPRAAPGRARSSPPITRGSTRALTQTLRRARGTVMLGRTLLQPAPPITFGLKAARWVAALSRGWRARRAPPSTTRMCCSSAARRERSRRLAIAARRGAARWRRARACRARCALAQRIAIGWRRWSPPAASTPARSAKSRATCRC